MRRHVLVFLAVALFPSALVARTWTDASGRHRREADFLYEQNGQVWLRDAEDRYFVVELSRLSQTDRDYVALRRDAALQDEAQRESPTAPVRTLAYRVPNPVATATTGDRTPGRLSRMMTEARVAKLTGWHCYGGHCHVTHHPPIKPCPVPPDTGKRIYKGRWSTFHLVCRHKQPAICGTGAYKFHDRQGCCHEYLELLHFTLSVPNFFLIYEVANPAPPLNVRFWLFEDVSFAKHHYNVSYWNSKAWVWYDCARLCIPE